MEYHLFQTYLAPLLDAARSWWDGTGLPLWIYNVVLMFAVSLGLIAPFISINVMGIIWLERKVSGLIQNRMGPMLVSFVRPAKFWTRHPWAAVWTGGYLQTVADSIKLLLKEDVIPARADKWVFISAPFVVFTASLMAYALVPFSDHLLSLKNFEAGFLYILAVTSYAVIGILMAGWSSNNKYSLLGGMRSAAQIISYEVPLVLSLLGVVMWTGSLTMEEIIVKQQQMGWFILYQPLAFLIFLIASVAETNRPPFDIPEAESELVAGYNTEYSGIRFAMFFLAEFANMLLASSVAATLFLGGWSGPSFLPGFVWFMIKVYFLIFLFMWIRWTFPRVRVDHLMEFGWKVLTPLALFNILFTGVEILVNRTFMMWILLGLIVLIGRVRSRSSADKIKETLAYESK